jgi:hypothetical protein
MAGKHTLSRRTMLRGMFAGATVALGLPTLEAMLNSHGTALADGSTLPRRLVTWFFGDGAKRDRWIPTAQGPGWAPSEELAPLAAVKEYVSVLSGFDNHASNTGFGHHDGMPCFSGFPFIVINPDEAAFSAKSGGPTVDQVAATALQGQTYLPSLQVGVSKRYVVDGGPLLYHLSHKGPDEPLPALRNPQDVWDKLFGNYSAPDDGSGPLRIGMLDAVRADVARLKARLGTSDRLRVDAHLEAIHQLQTQIAQVPPECTVVAEPTVLNENDQNGNEPLEEVSKVMAELVRIALACDITRVVSWMQSGSVGYTVYHMVGASDGIHDLTHMDDPGAQELVHKSVVFNMTMLAHLVHGMKDTPEGAGNLLDNACILVGSDCSEGFDHSTFDQPLLVIGRGGGDLVHPGLHYRSASGESTSDVLLTCLKTVVPTATEVGAGAGRSTTPCNAIKV